VPVRLAQRAVEGLGFGFALTDVLPHRQVAVAQPHRTQVVASADLVAVDCRVGEVHAGPSERLAGLDDRAQLVEQATGPERRQDVADVAPDHRGTGRARPGCCGKVHELKPEVNDRASAIAYGACDRQRMGDLVEGGTGRLVEHGTRDGHGTQSSGRAAVCPRAW